MKTKKRRPLPAALCALIMLVLSIVLGYAAYYGKGNFKDVFVNRRNCFTSDVLASVSDREEVPRSTFYFSSGKVINLFNYDLSTGEYNAFSMEFSVYAWLDKTPADGQEYYLTIGGQEKKVASTAADTPVFTGIPLPGGVASKSVMTVRFHSDADLSDYPRLNLYVIPTTPAYMQQKRLGGCIVPTSDEGFTAVGRFVYSDGDDIEDYAAFPYEVTMSGRLDESKKGFLRVEWDPANLTLMTQYNALPAGVDVQHDAASGKDYILLPLTEDGYTRLTFLRVQDPQTGADNPWANTANPVTWAQLKGFVTVKQIQDAAS